MVEHRRILLEGAVTPVVVAGDELVAGDGRRVAATDAVHLPPCEPSKILCVHLNHISRVQEFQAKLPPAPTYFHKPTSSLNSHRGDVVRPEGCHWLNYEGEVVIVIGRPCRNVSPDPACATTCCGRLKITEIGWISVNTTMPVASEPRTILPSSTWRMPVTPSIGEAMVV